MLYMARRPSSYQPRECSGCWTEFVPTHGGQRYCGPSCRAYTRGGVKVCGACGGEFFASHRNAAYCSDECRSRAWSPRKPVQVWACEICGVEFSDSRRRRYCSASACAAEVDRRWQREYQRSKRPRRVCVTCGEEYWKPGPATWCASCSPPRTLFPSCRLSERPKARLFIGCVCRGCGSAFVVAPYTDGKPQVGEPVRARYCSLECSNRANMQAGRARRRARLKGARGAETVYRRKVFERDNWICRLCLKPVDRDAKVPHPKAPTIDHILPLELGGLHEYLNVQCAHFICNSRKSANVSQLSFAA